MSVCTDNKMKKVSIVVPVYNSEKYLGYCINSILSQTYTNIELILVNDGSQDNSINICNNYALIDPRVKVIDIPNSGVSHARNVGIENATGDYLQFVDSDDVIANNMIELLVHSMEVYHMDIVFCGMKMVTLKDNIPQDIKICTSEGIGKQCVLSRKIFLQNMACLLWKTAMLEGPCNKLYKREIIINKKIEFPEEITLGEDFLFNMDYYENVNGAVFLEEKLYYYLQVNDSALTKKIRLDIFENQMMLIEKFENFLRRNIELSKSEKIYISEYTIDKVIQCLKAFMNNSNLEKDDVKNNISIVINNEQVRRAFQYGKYIDPGYEWIREACRFCDVNLIYEKIFSEFHKMVNDKEEIKNPGIINKILVLILNEILKIHSVRKLEMIRNSLIDFGIKVTINKSIRYCIK